MERSKGLALSSIGVAAACLLGWKIFSVRKKRFISASSSVTSSEGGGLKVYETEKAVNEYLQFHYGDPATVMPYAFAPKESFEFLDACALLCERFTPALQNFTGEEGEPTAIDMGCAVGGASFLLARCFPYVLGIDFSQAFVEVANHMKKRGSREYKYLVEGNIHESALAYVPSDIERERVSFRQGDACNLPESLAPVDAILAANLLCRLPDPLKFLKRLPSLLKSSGIVVIASPYSWLESWTPTEKWLGGLSKTSGITRSKENITLIMESLGFKLIHSDDLPFIMREHERKFQLGVSHATVWARN